ncbi:MAG TPA: hypothetical protein VF884_06505 [Nitrososphaeraceae archaeon]
MLSFTSSLIFENIPLSKLKVFSTILGKNKKYQINFKGAYYNFRTGSYERRDVGI